MGKINSVCVSVCVCVCECVWLCDCVWWRVGVYRERACERLIEKGKGDALYHWRCIGK